MLQVLRTAFESWITSVIPGGIASQKMVVVWTILAIVVGGIPLILISAYAIKWFAGASSVRPIFVAMLLGVAFGKLWGFLSTLTHSLLSATPTTGG